MIAILKVKTITTNTRSAKEIFLFGIRIYHRQDLFAFTEQ